MMRSPIASWPSVFAMSAQGEKCVGENRGPLVSVIVCGKRASFRSGWRLCVLR